MASSFSQVNISVLILHCLCLLCALVNVSECGGRNTAFHGGYAGFEGFGGNFDSYGSYGGFGTGYSGGGFGRGGSLQSALAGGHYGGGGGYFGRR